MKCNPKGDEKRYILLKTIDHIEVIGTAEIVDIHEKKLDIPEKFVKTPLLKIGDQYFGLAWMEEEYRLHKHNVDEFFLVIEGHLTIEVSGKVHDLDPGMGVLIKAGEPHKSKASPKTLVGIFEPQKIKIEYLD